MSNDEHDEHDAHGHDDGAHEIDKMPSRKLFNLLFGLSGLTLVACIGVVQLFYQQVRSIRGARDAKVSFQLTEYREEMADLRDNWGAVWMQDDDGIPAAERGKGLHEAKRFHMPLAEARKRMLEEPAKYLKAAPAYPRWKNPDPNAPQAQAGQRLRPGARPGMRPQPGARPGVRQPGMRPQPGAQPQPGMRPQPGAQPARPVPPPEGKAPAKPPKPEGKAEGKAPAKPPKPAKPAKPEGKAEGKAPAKPDGKGAQ